jgi:hypothetical protein
VDQPNFLRFPLGLVAAIISKLTLRSIAFPGNRQNWLNMSHHQISMYQKNKILADQLWLIDFRFRTF